MMLLFYSLVALWLGLEKPAEQPKPEAPAKAAAAYRDHCRVFGSVYLERDPGRKSYTNGSIYLEEEEAFANVVVFKEDNKLFADAPGLWYITDNRAFADHVLFVTPNRAFADFFVYFTTVRSFAGCKD